MTAATVFLVPDGELGQQMRATYAHWAEAGIVDEAAWVTPADVVIQQVGPPQVAVQVIGPQGTHREELFGYLGRRRRDRVRLVAAQVLVEDSAVAPPGFIEAAESLGTAIRRSAPQSLTAGGHTTQVSRLNVIVPVSGLRGAAENLVIPGWEVNAVVSAEDRPDADHGSVFVRLPGNGIGHAVSALAGIGGTLHGIDAGPFDETDQLSTTNGNEVVLVRPLVRGVVGADAESQLVTVTLDRVHESGNGVVDYQPWATVPHRPERLSDELLDYLLTQPPWAPTPEAIPVEPGQVQRSLKRGFGDAARFNLQMFSVVPRWVALALRGRIEDVATSKVVGIDTDSLLRLRPLDPAAARSMAQAQLLGLNTAPLQTMMEHSGDSTHAPPAMTWAPLRNLSFAAVDGGDLPEELPPPQYGEMRELLAPARVAPDPADEFRFDGLVIRPYEFSEFGQVETAMQAAAAEIESAPVEDAEAASLRAAELSEARQSYADWTARAEKSMLGGLLVNLWTRAAQLRREHDFGMSQVVLEAPLNNRLVDAREKLLRGWKWTVILWLILSILAAVLGTNQRLRELPENLHGMLDWFSQYWFWLIVGLTLLALIALILFNHGYYKAMRRYFWEVRSQAHQQRRQTERIIYCGNEASRLEQLARALQDWVGIIGWVIHHPRGEVKSSESDIEAEVIESFPASLGVARALPNQVIPARLIAQSAQLLYPKGWAARAFDHSYADYSVDATHVDRAGVIAADLDPPNATSGPRAELLDYWASGRAAAGLTINAVETMKEAVTDGRIELTVRNVVRLGEHGHGEPVREPEYFRAAGAPSTAFALEMLTDEGVDGKQAVAKSEVWLPAGVEMDDTAPATRRHPSGPSMALRVDVSRALLPSEVSIFDGGVIAQGVTSQPEPEIAFSLRSPWA